jgi:hypothetical protein
MEAIPCIILLLAGIIAARVANADRDQPIVQNIEHQEGHPPTSSALARSKRELASAILKSTVTMAANIAQSPGVHQHIRTVGDIVIVIIQRLKVSVSCLFSESSYSFVPFLANKS